VSARRSILALALALVGSLGGVAHGEPVAITNASVIVKPGTRIDKATVVIDKGKIVAVGAAVKAPAGARVIDATGKVVTAGLIDAVSQLGLIGIDGEPSSNDGRLGSTDPVHHDPIHASFDVRDAYHASEATIPVARAAGVTLVVATPFGGLVGGQTAAFALDGAPDPIKAPTGMYVALGAAGAGAAGGSRGAAIEMLRELLDDARAYGKDRASYERNARRKLLADRLDLEALQPVLAGKLPLVVQASAEADIRAALRLATQQKVSLVIVGGEEAWRAAADLAKAKVAVILDPTANLPGDLAASDIQDDAAAVLDKAGVTVVISTLGGSWDARRLRQLAGNAVGHGLPWDKAFAAVTTVPAATFRLTGRGALDVGSVADVVVWSGDPFETSTAAEHVIINGVEQSLANHQTKLLDRYRKLPAK
jgi:imidazolonepropionase-like amidohydrolase